MLPHQQQFTYTFPSKEGDLGRHYCASEILHEKLKNDKKLLWNAANDDFSPIEAGKTRRKDTIYGKQRHHYEYSTRRNKRWLPDQVFLKLSFKILILKVTLSKSSKKLKRCLFSHKCLFWNLCYKPMYIDDTDDQ